MDRPVAIVLAAGKSTRMKSELPKVLHPVCGRPMLDYVLDAVGAAGARKVLVVVGYRADLVRQAVADRPDVECVLQDQQLGTGHAVKVCQAALADYQGPVLVLVGDQPLIRGESLRTLLDAQREQAAACLLGTAVLDNPSGYGRIVRGPSGAFQAVVEQKDATPAEAAIREVNPSDYVFDAGRLFWALDRVDRGNVQNEYYLTDVPAVLRAAGDRVLALPVLDPVEVLGVNRRNDLAEVHARMQDRIHQHWMAEGVSIVDPRNTYIDSRATIGAETVIFPFTAITGRVEIGRNCRVGPLAHLRDGVRLADSVEAGAFVELNRSELGPGTRVRHLAYLGDARVGPGVNVGAGAITANYDGRSKHPTTIEAGAFIGAGAVLVAPVQVGQGGVVGAGAVVTRNHDVAPGQTVIGVPARPKEPARGHPT